ncbi:MAG: P63C domain-containing protein [Gammaproteobacteria bacterium]
MTSNENPKAKGGHARAEVLSPDERASIARKAALARWDAEVPQVTHEGDFRIGATTVSAAVLPNGMRLLIQATFLRAIGRSPSPKAGTGVLSTVDSTPFFLQAETLQPFISEDLMRATTPFFFRTRSGKRAVGYDAQLLPRVADVYLRFRDACTAADRPVPKQYQHIVKACDILTRGLAAVGIVALVDEATGYQEVRDRLALQAILDKFLQKEFATWAKRFPDDFYREIFRLKGWQWRGMKVNRPQVVARYTKDIVYARLAPGILEELEQRNPKDERGNRRAKHHQWLTEDVGHPALAQHLYAAIGLMRISDTWEDFKRFLDRAYPKRKDTAQLPLFSES